MVGQGHQRFEFTGLVLQARSSAFITKISRMASTLEKGLSHCSGEGVEVWQGAKRLETGKAGRERGTHALGGCRELVKDTDGKQIRKVNSTWGRMAMGWGGEGEGAKNDSQHLT